MGNFVVRGCGDHYFDIRPMWKENFDVVYFKDGATREKKFNLNAESLKEYIKEKFDCKLNYVEEEYNKAADQAKDKTEKVEGAVKNDPVKHKKVTSEKKEDKDYNEECVKKKEDQPDQPMAEVEDIKKQSDHSKKGTKPSYERPKDTFKKRSISGKKHVVKGTIANKRFKGLPKGK